MIVVLPRCLCAVAVILVVAAVNAASPEQSDTLNQTASSSDQPGEDWEKVLKNELVKTKRTLLAGIRKAFSSSDCSDVFGATIAQQALAMAELQAKVWALETELNSTRAQLHSTGRELRAATSELAANISRLQERVEDQLGSTFIRWGQKKCSNESTLIYHGLTGGKAHNEKGGGTNLLCLSKTFQHDGTTTTGSVYAKLHAAEYQGIPGTADRGVPCALCRAFQATTIMVPATRTCPTGWKAQYTGRLVSQYFSYYATEYVCLDAEADVDDDVVKNHNKHLLFYVVADCSSLPCTKSSKAKVVTCVVCSK